MSAAEALKGSVHHVRLLLTEHKCRGAAATACLVTVPPHLSPGRQSGRALPQAVAQSCGLCSTAPVC